MIEGNKIGCVRVNFGCFAVSGADHGEILAAFYSKFMPIYTEYCQYSDNLNVTMYGYCSDFNDDVGLLFEKVPVYTASVNVTHKDKDKDNPFVGGFEYSVKFDREEDTNEFISFIKPSRHAKKFLTDYYNFQERFKNETKKVV